MTNEYGVPIDHNHYSPSILPVASDGCFICMRTDRPLQRHEIFHGPFRTRSKELGLWVNICDECHMVLHQQDSQIDRNLKEVGQKWAQIHYVWSVEDFRNHFGKNFLEEV